MLSISSRKNDFLEKKFCSVWPVYYKLNYPESIDFLTKILDYYKIDVFEFRLTANHIMESPQVLLASKILKLSSAGQMREFSISESNFVALHEIQHIRQLLDGDTTVNPDRTLSWCGWHDRLYPQSPHELKPWEQDANLKALDCPLFDKNWLTESKFVGDIYKHYNIC